MSKRAEKRYTALPPPKKRKIKEQSGQNTTHHYTNDIIPISPIHTNDSDTYDFAASLAKQAETTLETCLSSINAGYGLPHEFKLVIDYYNQSITSEMDDDGRFERLLLQKADIALKQLFAYPTSENVQCFIEAIHPIPLELIQQNFSPVQYNHHTPYKAPFRECYMAVIAQSNYDNISDNAGKLVHIFPGLDIHYYANIIATTLSQRDANAASDIITHMSIENIPYLWGEADQFFRQVAKHFYKQHQFQETALVLESVLGLAATGERHILHRDIGTYYREAGQYNEAIRHFFYAFIYEAHGNNPTLPTLLNLPEVGTMVDRTSPATIPNLTWLLSSVTGIKTPSQQDGVQKLYESVHNNRFHDLKFLIEIAALDEGLTVLVDVPYPKQEHGCTIGRYDHRQNIVSFIEKADVAVHEFCHLAERRTKVIEKNANIVAKSRVQDIAKWQRNKPVLTQKAIYDHVVGMPNDRKFYNAAEENEENIVRLCQAIVLYGNDLVMATLPNLYNFYYKQFMPACKDYLQERKTYLLRSAIDYIVEKAVPDSDSEPLQHTTLRRQTLFNKLLEDAKTDSILSECLIRNFHIKNFDLLDNVAEVEGQSLWTAKCQLQGSTVSHSLHVGKRDPSTWLSQISQQRSNHQGGDTCVKK